MYMHPQHLPTPLEYRVYVRPELFVHGCVVSSASKWTLRKILDYLHELFVFLHGSSAAHSLSLSPHGLHFPHLNFPEARQPSESNTCCSDTETASTACRCCFRLTRHQWLAFTKLRSSHVSSTPTTATPAMLSMSAGQASSADPPGTPTEFSSPTLRPRVAPNTLLCLPSSPSPSSRFCSSPRLCPVRSPTSAAHSSLSLPDVDVEALWNILSVLSWHSSSSSSAGGSWLPCCALGDSSVLGHNERGVSAAVPSCGCSTCLATPSSSPSSADQPPPTVDIRQLGVLLITQLFRSYMTARRHKDLRFTDAVWASPQSPVACLSPIRDLWCGGDDVRTGGGGGGGTTPGPRASNGEDEGGSYGRVGSPLSGRNFSANHRLRGTGAWDSSAMDADAVVSFISLHIWALLHITAGGGIWKGDSCGARTDEEVDAAPLNLLEMLLGTRGGISLRDRIIQDLAGSFPSPADSQQPTRILISDVAEWLTRGIYWEERLYPSKRSIEAAAASQHANASQTFTNLGFVNRLGSTHQRPQASSALSTPRRTQSPCAGEQAGECAPVPSGEGSTSGENNSADRSGGGTGEICSGGAVSSKGRVLSPEGCSYVRGFTSRTFYITEEDVPRRSDIVQLIIADCHDCDIYVCTKICFAFLSGCSECRVFLCGVDAVVSVQSCNKLRLHAAARIIRLENTLDTIVNAYCVYNPIMLGDTRGILLGPFNVLSRILLHTILDRCYLSLQAKYVTHWAYPICCQSTCPRGLLGGSMDGIDNGASDSRQCETSSTASGGGGGLGGSGALRRKGSDEKRTGHIYQLIKPEHFSLTTLPESEPSCKTSPTSRVVRPRTGPLRAGEGDVAGTGEDGEDEKVADGRRNEEEQDGSDYMQLVLPEVYANSLKHQAIRMNGIQNSIRNLALPEEIAQKWQQVITLKFQEWIRATNRSRQLHDFVRLDQERLHLLPSGRDGPSS
eukprot:GHVS01029062.1.p1 GENE.GHVS01029062.1~~GHVS01029062.1.p1  ORF type:complete len:958 (-),score=149.69 GHVS01029062.1:194-3067(-)